MTKQLVKPSSPTLNVQLSILIDLEEYPESEPDLPKKKKKKNTPSSLPPSSPQKFDFVYGEHSNFILPNFGFEPVGPYLHENPPVSKYVHMEYNLELFNPQQFDYGYLDDNSHTQEPCGEHIPKVSATSTIPFCNCPAAEEK